MGLFAAETGVASLKNVPTQYRVDSVLIRGTNQMSTDQVFNYLLQNGQRPTQMEWVNDTCCT